MLNKQGLVTGREYELNTQCALNSEVRLTTRVYGTLPTKHQGRPLLLGKELDQKVQEFITTTRANKGVINTTIVMGAAEGIIYYRS